jgi:hypothetical protein
MPGVTRRKKLSIIGIIVGAANSAMRFGPIIVRDFYAQPTIDVARNLLAKIIVHGPTAGMIVEAEAYMAAMKPQQTPRPTSLRARASSSDRQDTRRSTSSIVCINASTSYARWWIKCDEQLTKEHLAQCINYLRDSGLHLAILINFRKSRVEWRRAVYDL